MLMKEACAKQSLSQTYLRVMIIAIIARWWRELMLLHLKKYAILKNGAVFI